MRGERLPAYYARICWNTHGWSKPAGVAKQAEATAGFVGKHGFGHEEWLFNFAWLIDGWHYGFIQGFNSSAVRQRHQETAVSVRLYSISPKPIRARLWIGDILECHVLSAEQAAVAVEAHREWIEDMRGQLQAVQADDSPLSNTDPLKIFNVRFKPARCVIHPEPIELPRDDPVWRFNRYTLVGASSVRKNKPRRFKRVLTKSELPVPIPETNCRLIDPVHNRLQNHMANALRSRYPEAEVQLESQRVDVRVDFLDETHLIELKTISPVTRSIDEGLGQLLRYAFQVASQSPRSRRMCLWIAGVGKPDSCDHDFLEWLSQRGVEVKYFQYTLGDTESPHLR